MQLKELLDFFALKARVQIAELTSTHLALKNCKLLPRMYEGCGLFLKVQGSALHFIELLEVPVNPFSQPVQVFPDGSTFFWPINLPLQFCTICELAEGTLCPIVQVFNVHVKQYWPCYQPLGYTLSD